MIDAAELIRKHALANAVQFDGKANASAVLGKVLAEQPELKKDIEKLRKEIAVIVKEINGWGAKKQKTALKELEKKFGEIKKPQQQQQREGLPELPGAIKGKVVTRFAPEPNGYLHLGHLKSAFLNFLYAKKYDGKMLLRFDDTNPAKEKKEFYDAIREDLKTFGIKYDKEIKESENMELFYKYCEVLIERDVFYVCECPQEKIKEMRAKGDACKCRSRSKEENIKLWKKMLKVGQKGEMAVRMKTQYDDPNPALRDPSMLRVVEAPHPLLGCRYRVYPMYNFACVIMDHEFGITHVLRDKGFENDAKIQEMLYALLGWVKPITIQFGRIKTVAGIPMSKRKIRFLIEQGKLRGFEDIRIPTPRNLIKRGFQPEAIKRLIEEIGPSKSDIDVSFNALETYNRQIIDSVADRYFFVAEPIEITLNKLPARTAKAPVHPSKRKYRKIPVAKKVFIEKIDFVANHDKEVRLMHLCNVLLDKKAKVTSLAKKDIPKIHWISKGAVRVKLVMPDGREVFGLAEPDVAKVRPDALVQFERIGFARCDKKNLFYFAHK